MPRDLFPREIDRWIIDKFLRGAGSVLDPHADVNVVDHKLMLIGNGASPLTIAWFDTAGSLTINILNGISFAPGARVVGYIATRLGMPEVTIHYETEDSTDPDGKFERKFKYFMEDKPVQQGSPVVLCGPMTVQAFRVT